MVQIVMETSSWLNERFVGNAVSTTSCRGGAKLLSEVAKVDSWRMNVVEKAAVSTTLLPSMLEEMHSTKVSNRSGACRLTLFYAKTDFILRSYIKNKKHTCITIVAVAIVLAGAVAVAVAVAVASYFEILRLH